MEFELSLNEFEVLAFIAERVDTAKTCLSQREISSRTNLSIGTVNNVVKRLFSFRYLTEGENSNNNKYSISDKGNDFLEHHRAKRAVFLAAGFGSRMVPITLNTPKPLVRVNGKRIIDSLIDACLANGINDIYIVRGYLAEQFDQLLYKYPMVKFIENPIYNETNNISSMLVARSLLSNTYVFESDLLLKNPQVIRKYHYSSDYLGIKRDRTDDWCFETKDGYITSQRIGGLNCYQEVGISYWSEEDGHRISGYIKEAFDQPGGKELFWDQVPLKTYRKEFKVRVVGCAENDVIEIDTFAELKKLDKTYAI